jgi:hypothetical protein
MTPTGPVEARAAVAPVHRCLAELNAALIRLDVDAIESCRNTLEELKPELQRSLDTSRPHHLIELRSLLQFAITLSHGATRFYTGWVRAGIPEGVAYTPTGREPGVDVAGCVAVRG